MYSVTSTFKGEEIEVTFSGNLVQSDYGIPHSPTIQDVDDIQIHTITILGVRVNEDDLPKALRDRIYDISTELVIWER